MKNKKYLIYLDILGFEGFAREIAKVKGINQRDVRHHLINIINDRIDFIELNGKIKGKIYGESDDWIIVTETLDDAFLDIFDILNHDIGYKDFKEIPLEIAIGIGEFETNSKLDGKFLIAEDATIDFLKTKIIDYYKDWFKNKYKQSLKSTFIIITESVYEILSVVDKNTSNKINYQKSEIQIIFFSIGIEQFIEKGKILKFLEIIGSKRFEYKEINEYS